MRNDNAIEQIKNRIRLSNFISRYLKIEFRNSKPVALCPFHDDHNPSLTIDDTKGSYKCWSCGASGDVFSFLMHMEKIDFPQALSRLAEECNVDLKVNHKNENLIKIKNILYDINNYTADEFERILHLDTPESVFARNYLEQRGIDESLSGKFKIGYSPNSRNHILDFLRSKNFSDKDIYSSGLFSKSRNFLFSDGRIVLPVIDERGRVVSFSARTLKRDKNIPKYINSSETLIFNKSESFFSLFQSLGAFRKKISPIVCEGNFDAIALHKAGLESAVASCGTAFTSMHAQLLSRFTVGNSNTIYIFPDNDEPGIKASFKWIETLIKHNLKVKVMFIDDKNIKDADEALALKGSEYLKFLFDNALIDVEYIYQKILESQESHRSDFIHFKSQIIKQFAWYYASLANKLEKQGLVDFLVDKLGVEKSIISDMLEGNNDLSSPIRANIRQSLEETYDFNTLENKPLYELDLINVLLKNRKYFDANILDEITYSDFKSAKARILYSVLCTSPIETRCDDDAFISSIDDENIKIYVKNLLSEKTQDEQERIQDIISESINLIKKSRIKSELKRLDVLKGRDENINTHILNKIMEYKRLDVL